MDPKHAEMLFLQHLSWIGRLVQKAAAQYGLFGEEINDFESLIRMRLIENNYAEIRNYTGASTFETYLAALVMRHLINHIRETRGRWRPSAAAQRLGPLAVRLETLVYRDNYPVSQAITKLQTSEPDVPEERELLGLLDQLPRREGLRPKEIDLDLFSTEAELSSNKAERADSKVLAGEAAQEREIVLRSLERALASLTEEDQVIVRLHFSQGLSIADVARALKLEQKPLYRRVDRLRVWLRGQLEREGVDKSMVRSALPGDTHA